MDENDIPVLNYDGNQVLGEGNWNAPRNLEQLQAAVSVLHKINGHDAPYIVDCKSCIGKANGCVLHSHRPIVVATGNPTKSQAYKNEVERVKKKRED